MYGAAASSRSWPTSKAGAGPDPGGDEVGADAGWVRWTISHHAPTDPDVGPGVAGTGEGLTGEGEGFADGFGVGLAVGAGVGGEVGGGAGGGGCC
jgi:hypothetical protein